MYDSFTFEKEGGNWDYIINPNDWRCSEISGARFSGTESVSITNMEHKLYAPYPNPFNPKTVISFEMRDASWVELVVYDIMGREMVKLYDGFMGAGYHEVVWDAEGQGSGVYFVRLTVDSRQSTVRKILLVK